MKCSFSIIPRPRTIPARIGSALWFTFPIGERHASLKHTIRRLSPKESWAAMCLTRVDGTQHQLPRLRAWAAAQFHLRRADRLNSGPHALPRSDGPQADALSCPATTRPTSVAPRRALLFTEFLRSWVGTSLAPIVHRSSWVRCPWPMSSSRPSESEPGGNPGRELCE